MAREGNNKKRRVADDSAFCNEQRERLVKEMRYVGSGAHKRSGAAYGFVPATNPFPGKDLCDKKRHIPPTEAKNLFQEGIRNGMMSKPEQPHEAPKYVWAVDEDGEVYEAKWESHEILEYHGYCLGRDDPERKYILEVWRKRCQACLSSN